MKGARRFAGQRKDVFAPGGKMEVFDNYECEGQMSIEDILPEETKMDSITTEMMENICDNLCRFPREMEQEELDEHCCDCKMGQFVCDILNEYNKIAEVPK